MYDITEVAGSIPLHELALLTFYILTGFYLVYTAVLYFHWNEYSVSKEVSKLTAIIYLIVTIPLLLVMGLATFVI
jgi:heme/copper-type cytochrome/quinol oxidase subunit 2